MTGTNACENAPSAKKRRMRFGILNATVNASMTGPEPNQAENAMSRARPVMRDNSVMKPTTDVAVSRRRRGRAGAVARFRGHRRVIAEASYVLDLPRVAPNNSRLFGPRPQRKSPLANIKSAKKRARQAIKRRAHNVALRSRVRTAIRRVMKAVEAGDKEAAKAGFAAVVPRDRSHGDKGILRKNRAAHYKSQLNAKLRAMP